VDIYSRYPTNSGVDPADHPALNRALDAASKAGFSNDGARSVVEVNIPPVNGPNKGVNGYVVVIVTYNHRRYISHLFDELDLPVKARDVARGRWAAFKDGIIVLDLSVSESLKANGNGTVSVTNADVIVNSNDPQATGGDGSNTIIKDIGGAFQLSGGVKSGT